MEGPMINEMLKADGWVASGYAVGPGGWIIETGQVQRPALPAADVPAVDATPRDPDA